MPCPPIPEASLAACWTHGATQEDEQAQTVDIHKSTVIDAETGVPVEEAMEEYLAEMDDMVSLFDSGRIEPAAAGNPHKGTIARAESRSRTAGSLQSGTRSLGSIKDDFTAHAGTESSTPPEYSGLGFWAYLVCCLIIAVGFSAMASWLWSDMGGGPDTLAFLKRYQKYKWALLGAVFAVLLALYVLDFFHPPHLPGRWLSFDESDFIFRWIVMALVGIGLVVAILLQAGREPTIPLAVTIFACPLFVLAFRHVTRPTKRYARAATTVLLQEVQMRIEALGQLAAREQDQKLFYSAASVAFVLAALMSLVLWVPYMVRGTKNADDSMRNSKDGGQSFIRLVAPFVVFVSFLVFASFTALRVKLNNVYSATDKRKAQLMIGDTARSKKALMQKRIHELHMRLAQAAATEHKDEILKTTRDTHQEYLVQHKCKMQQLSALVRALSTAFVAVLGALYIVFQLTLADSHVAFLVQGFIAGYFATFVVVICVSCSRLFRVMHESLVEMSIWKSAVAAGESDWARAIAVTLLLPAFLVLLAASFVNQAVRKCRGLDSGDRLLTAKVSDLMEKMRHWDWLPIAKWCYIIASLVICYKLAPTFVNVLLARMNAAMEGLDFFLICATTFGLGMFLFMLPPVPGPPIYLFGGYVISPACKWGGPEVGFWIGTGICVALCFFLKLAACAVQQKIIGECLGNRQWVRELCGVHKPFIRAIESVLRRPGMSFGKCMILCGGPDWPTSVLAGILRLSLWQCLLGTLPIIANVVPLTLTGSFLVKRSDGDIWVRAGRLMFTVTALVSVVFWAGMAWAIQDEFERNHWELTKPKEEYIELDWLDFRRDYILTKCGVKYGDLPRWLKAMYFGCALMLIIVSNLFLWRSSKCFGKFEVTQDVGDLTWVDLGRGDGALILLWGLIGLVAAGVSYVGLVAYSLWLKQRNDALVAEAVIELAEKESSWKAARLQEARDAKTKPPPLPPVPMLKTMRFSQTSTLASGLGNEHGNASPMTPPTLLTTGEGARSLRADVRGKPESNASTSPSAGLGFAITASESLSAI